MLVHEAVLYHSAPEAAWKWKGVMELTGLIIEGGTEGGTSSTAGTVSSKETRAI